jgi:hypothetical protein
MNRKIVAGSGVVAGALAAALISMATANADRGADIDPFTDAGVPNGAALDALLPFPSAFELDQLVDAYPPFDPNDFAISVNGVTLFQVGTATAQSGTGDIAIADGADSKAIAGGVDQPGQFDTAVADGPGSLALSGNGNFDSAFVNGADSFAAAGSGAQATGNGDFVEVLGADSKAFAGAFFGNTVPSSNDYAVIDDPFGSVGDNAVAGGGNSDYAAVLGDSSNAAAGLDGNSDFALTLADSLNASATGGSFLTDILP